MRKDKVLLIFGIIALIIGFFVLLYTSSDSLYNHIGNFAIGMGSALTVISFITKKRLDKGELLNDERTIKIAYKAMSMSWFLTFLTLCLSIILYNTGIITNAYGILGFLMFLMIVTYYIPYLIYYKKKI